jgi:L-malate glycosyltransferase
VFDNYYWVLGGSDALRDGQSLQQGRERDGSGDVLGVHDSGAVAARRWFNRMNLALCSAGEIFGGVERQILDLCSWWTESGHKPPVIILFQQADLADRLQDLSVAPEIVRGRNRFDYKVVNAFMGILRDRRIDVVHTHGYKATITAALAKRKYKFRIVKTEHGKLEPSLATPWTWLKSRSYYAIDQYLTRRYVDMVCYVTHDIANHFVNSHAGIKRRVVHNGIGQLAVCESKRPSDLPTDRIHLGVVGRLSRIKGIPVAVRALAMPQVPANVHLVVIGSGPVEAEVLRVAAATGIANRVHLIGFRDNVFDYLSNLDGLLMPSFHEGLPYTLLEAMSLGCPIIASDVGGLREVLAGTGGGILVQAGDVSALAAAIVGLVDGTTEVEKLRSRAQALVSEKYSLHRMANDYYECYRKTNDGNMTTFLKQ